MTTVKLLSASSGSLPEVNSAPERGPGCAGGLHMEGCGTNRTYKAMDAILPSKKIESSEIHTIFGSAYPSSLSQTYLAAAAY